MVLNGKLDVMAGREGFQCEAGPWTVLAAETLRVEEGQYLPGEEERGPLTWAVMKLRQEPVLPGCHHGRGHRLAHAAIARTLPVPSLPRPPLEKPKPGLAFLRLQSSALSPRVWYPPSSHVRLHRLGATKRGACALHPDCPVDLPALRSPTPQPQCRRQRYLQQNRLL